jgi:flagellar hook-associated protein 1 FlgK
MSLTSAMNSAQSIFNNTGTQTDVISKNIANVGNANYVKRTAILGTTMNGANVVTMGRSQNESLLRQTIASSSLASGQSTVLTGLEEVKSMFGGNDNEASPSAYLTKLLKSFDTYLGKPGDYAAAATVVNTATDLATSLSSSSKELQAMRTRADKEIVLQVDKLNSLLAKFEEANTAVKVASATKEDPSSALDERETLLKEISSIVGVSAVTRENNDVVLYTSDGTTLFEVVPRKVTFAPNVGYDATIKGNSIFIDGVALKPGTGNNTTASGSLAGLLQVRDDIAPTMQSQLDEIARGLVTIFAESPADPLSTLPKLPGLFTYEPVATATVPGTSDVVPGLAASIMVNPKLVIAQGGKPELIRDGGINGAAYVKNSGNAAGYTTLISSYMKALEAPLDFDEKTRIDTNTSILKYASNSIGWLEQERSGATSANEAKSALYEKASTSYSNNTAVSLDEELSLLLDIEQSYKAATKLVTTIDEMLDSLMQMVR